MNNNKVIAPFHEAVRNSIIILSVAGLRVAFRVITEKQQFEWSGEYIRLILIWMVAILGICFGHAYLGSKIGSLKAGLVMVIICTVTLTLILMKTMN
ncbi:MAG: hypothetical protein K9M45_04240 [Kiritimatiellales bacterium]|nr:hypothetical protein [Kiritimatiellales bacterium]